MKYHLRYISTSEQFQILETGRTIKSDGGEVVFSNDNLETVTACGAFCMGYLSAVTNPGPEVLKDIINNNFVLSYSKLKSSVFLDNL